MAADAAEAAVIVAHPDDESLWCGGVILQHPEWHWHIVTLCRGSDPDRAPRFAKALEELDATGAMADLDDGPDQTPLDLQLVRSTIERLVPQLSYDYVFTHGPLGEYTRHRRHEECSRAVTELWQQDVLRAGELWMFAYEDGGRKYLPRPRADSDRLVALTEPVFQRKRRLISEVYGFEAQSWEASVVPKIESFWCFTAAKDAALRLAALEPPA